MKTFFIAMTIVLFCCIGLSAESKKKQPEDKPYTLQDSLATHAEELFVSRPKPKPRPLKPFIGISMEGVHPPVVEKAGGPKNCGGVKVSALSEGTPAHKANMKVGDIIVGYMQKGKKVLFAPPADEKKKFVPVMHIVELMKQVKPGDTVEFLVLRSGAVSKIAVKLGVRKQYHYPAASHPELEVKTNKPSRFERYLHENKLYDKYVAIVNKLYEASNFQQGATVIVKDQPDFFRLREVTYLMRNPERTSLVADQIADSMEAQFNEKNKDLAKAVTTAAKWLDEPSSTYHVRGLNGNSDDMKKIVQHIQYCEKMRDEAFSALTAEEKEALKNLPGFYTRKNEVDDKVAALRAAAKVDFKKFFAACAAFTEMTNQLEAIKKCAEAYKCEDVKNVKGVLGKVLYYAETPIGRVVIGGEDDNVYTEDFAVIIDLGGSDVYKNNAGGSRADHAFALCIDFTGDDLYLRSQCLNYDMTDKYAVGSDFSQGSGFLGAGVLVDVEGNDTYRSNEAYAQGYAVMGVGILADYDGCDTYRGLVQAQGAAFFGIGLLADGYGEDTYRVGQYGQGLGLCKGFGAIIDTHGNEEYYIGGVVPDTRGRCVRCYKAMGQGFGFGIRPYSPIGTSGGIGLLADAQGEDKYMGDFFCQGGSYWYALGILRDKEGSDIYYCGQYSQGSATHLTVAALIDCAGDDDYICYQSLAQGCGHDWSYGILEDRGGNDAYRAGYFSQGIGSACGIGVLFDLEGNDDYTGGGRTQGHGHYAAAREMGSVGVLLDLGGTDRYTTPNGGANNTQLVKVADFGAFIDVDKEAEHKKKEEEEAAKKQPANAAAPPKKDDE